MRKNGKLHIRGNGLYIYFRVMKSGFLCMGGDADRYNSFMYYFCMNSSFFSFVSVILLVQIFCAVKVKITTIQKISISSSLARSLLKPWLEFCFFETKTLKFSHQFVFNANVFYLLASCPHHTFFERNSCILTAFVSFNMADI